MNNAESEFRKIQSVVRNMSATIKSWRKKKSNQLIIGAACERSTVLFSFYRAHTHSFGRKMDWFGS